MPTYNGAETILMAVNSVLQQTYKNMQIIIVDDNGNNTSVQKQTEKILNNYIKTEKIFYVKHEINKNGSAARNTGLRYAKGEYICFLDDDDYFFPNKIERQVQLFEQLDQSYGLVVCSGYIVKPNGIGYKLDIPNDSDEHILFDLLSGKIKFNSSMIMVRRDVAIEIGGFDETYIRHQDWEFVCRVLDKYKGKKIKEYLVAKYSMSRNVLRNLEDQEKIRSYFLENNLSIINKMSDKEKKEIYAYHHRDLALNSFLAGDFFRMLKHLIVAGNPVVQFYYMSKYALNVKLKKRIRCAPQLVQNDCKGGMHICI